MTIKELAEELSVSKPAINNKLIDLGLKDRLIKQGNKYVIPGEVADQVRQSFTKQKPKPADDNETAAELCQALREQIEQLTETIRILNNQLEEKDKQIERAQTITFRLTAGSPGNTQRDLHEVEDVIVSEKTDTDQRRSIFSKLFR